MYSSMTVNRRQALIGITLATASVAVASTSRGVRAHTPYGQWVVYRQKHLLIGSHRGDLQTYDLAQEIVAALEAELPEASARVARGPRPQRIASLMSTGQLMTAVLSEGEAKLMAEAHPPFDGYLPTPLTVLAGLGGGYSLFASPDLPERHAWLLVEALDHADLVHTAESSTFQVHPGAEAFWKGEPLMAD
jgi:hypothetical protein